LYIKISYKSSLIFSPNRFMFEWIWHLNAYMKLQSFFSDQTGRSRPGNAYMQIYIRHFFILLAFKEYLELSAEIV